tara:strand:+ start:273 stop:440 length:168 start_codon:yes stop_codon:yes gene_type:complete
MKGYRLFFFLISRIIFAQNDFLLEDVNPASDTFGQNIGPSYFNNTVRVVGFFHEY